MKLPQHKKIRWNYTAIAFAIPCIGMLAVMMMARSCPFGGNSMLHSDMYHQYYPFFVAFRRALVSGDSLLWSWNVGMGMDYLGLISYYLASPLYLVSVLLPEGMLLPYFSLLLPLRLGLAGMFFAIFLKKLFHRDDLSISLFGALYALCAWALGYQWNLMWLDTFLLLPLVALGTVSLLQKRKFVLYTVTLFLSVYANYYIGFFTCIFVALIFFCYEICRWNGFRRFFQDLGWMALCSGLAIGMTAILELPALAALQTTQSSVNRFPSGFRLNIADENSWKGLLDAMRQVAGNLNGNVAPTFKEGLPNIYCGIITTVLAVLFLTSKKVSLRERLCSIGLLLFFTLSFIIRQLDYIWHGFHFPNMIPYRFSFLLSFVMLYMAYRAWLLRKDFRPWQLITAGIVGFGVIVCNDDFQLFTQLFTGGVRFLPWNGQNLVQNLLTVIEHSSFVIYNLSFLVFYVAMLFLASKKFHAKKLPDREDRADALQHQLRVRRIGSSVLLGAVGLELAMNLVNFGVNFPFTDIGTWSYPRNGYDAEFVLDEMRDREKDNLFYRTEVTHSQTLNDGALNNYNGISTFTSSANVRVTEFMRALGYGAKNTYNRYCYEESSPVPNLFLNLRYMIERDGNLEENSYFRQRYRMDKVVLLENNFYLPLGFLTNPELKNLKFDGNANPFLFQNRLLQAAAGTGGNAWHLLSGGCLAVEADEGITLSNQSASGYCSYSAPQGGKVRFRYTADSKGFVCINLNLPKRNKIQIFKNDTALYSETYSVPQTMSACEVRPGDVITVELTCKAGENSTMTVGAAILDKEQFKRAHHTLAKSTLKLTDFSNTYIAGNIRCNRDGLLYTSIPQNGNWHAVVDGQEVETCLVGDAMLALDLTKGDHQVSFYYENPAFSLGWKVSLICLIGFLGLYVWLYKPYTPWTQRGKYEKKKEKHSHTPAELPEQVQTRESDDRPA